MTYQSQLLCELHIWPAITTSFLSHAYVAEYIWCMTLYGMVPYIILTFTKVCDWRFFLMFGVHRYRMVLFIWNSVCFNETHIVTVLTVAMVPFDINNMILWCCIVLLNTWHRTKIQCAQVKAYTEKQVLCAYLDLFERCSFSWRYNTVSYCSRYGTYYWKI